MPTKNNINKIKDLKKSYISKLQFNKGMERKAVENGNYNFSSVVRRKIGNGNGIYYKQ